MKKYKLGDLGKIVTGKTPRTSIEENYGGDIPFITPSDDLSVKDIREVSKKITELGLKEVKNCLLPPRSICVSCIGSDMGKVVMTSVPSVTNQQFNSIIPNESFDADYIYYLMISIGQQMKNKLGKQSTAVPIVSKSQFSDIDVSIICDIKDQKKVSSVLSSIDNRIENLRAQNRVLEQTAKTIYDYTFLQCAGHQTTYNKTLNRNIPTNWEVKNIFDVFDIKYGFPFSTELFTEEITDKPVVRIRDILEHTTSAYTTEIVDEKYRLQEGDLVIGMDGNFHMNLWTDNISYLNQRCVRIRMNDNNVTSVQAKFALAPYIKAKEMTAKGSTVGHLSDKDLKGMFILVPDSKTLKNFNAQVLPIFQKQLVNTKQIEALTTQRNTLLPLLMTGQVEV